MGQSQVKIKQLGLENRFMMGCLFLITCTAVSTAAVTDIANNISQLAYIQSVPSIVIEAAPEVYANGFISTVIPFSKTAWH